MPQPGSKVQLPVQVEELVSRGEATLVAISPCPPIDDSPGNTEGLVTTTVSRMSDNLYELTIATANGDVETLRVTGMHPFHSEERGWIAASELRQGEALTTHDPATGATVSSLDRLPSVWRVYNFTVDHAHVYHVGDARVLVHNDYQIIELRLNGKVSQKNVSPGNYKRYQEHHFATNKSKAYTPQMERIAQKYGLDLDEAWNKEMLPHLGRHANVYHDFALEGMRRAAREAGNDKALFKQLFEKYVKEPIRENPDLLYKRGWE